MLIKVWFEDPEFINTSLFHSSQYYKHLLVDWFRQELQNKHIFWVPFLTCDLCVKSEMNLIKFKPSLLHCRSVTHVTWTWICCSITGSHQIKLKNQINLINPINSINQGSKRDLSWVKDRSLRSLKDQYYDL